MCQGRMEDKKSVISYKALSSSMMMLLLNLDALINNKSNFS